MPKWSWSIYAHHDFVVVKKGQKVSAGQVIGYLGSTGKVTSSHLHFEVRKKAESKVPYGWITDRKANCLDTTAYLESFVDDKTETSSQGTYKVVNSIGGYVTASNAKAHKNKKTTVKPGTYHLFNEAHGMLNITSKKGVPGSWINPSDNKKPSTKKKVLHLPASAETWRVTLRMLRL